MDSALATARLLLLYVLVVALVYRSNRVRMGHEPGKRRKIKFSPPSLETAFFYYADKIVFDPKGCL